MSQYQIQSVPICIKRGSTTILPITYKDRNGDPIDLTGYTAAMHVRRSPDSIDDPDIELTTENDGIAITAASGLITVTILSQLTLDLESGYEGFWDLFLIPTEETAFYLVGGTFNVLASVTRL